MILPDANLLIYAFREDAPQFPVARHWLEQRRDFQETLHLHPLAAAAFLRLATRKIGPYEPSPVFQALDFLAALQPLIPESLPEDAGHLEIVRRLAERHGIAGDGCNDLWLAAFAIRHGLTLASADRGFARFQPELNWINPLDCSS